MRTRIRRWLRALPMWRVASPGSEDTAAILSRCAAMLRGGVPPAAVFGPGLAVDGIGEQVAAGAPIAEAIAGAARPEWRFVAAAWSLAEETGAPLASALDRIAAALRARTAVQERQSVLLAGPRATVRLVLGLPPLVLGLGWLLGFDPTPVLLSPLGAVLLTAGGSLLAAGAVWARWLLRSAVGEDRVVGGAYDLLWIALGSGRRPDEAVRSVVCAVDRFEVRWVPFDDFLRDADIQVTLRRVERLGVAVRPALLEAARAERTRSLAELERSAERLGVRVLGPLGACVLPSFMVTGVVPVVISMLGGGPT